MNIRQYYLLISAIGLTPIALSYGLVPQKSLDFLFGLQVQSPNGVHIFRAIMGLYLALVIFWLLGVMKVRLRQAAILSEVVFMLGLAAGRLLSLLIDGWAHWLLTVYLVLELGLGMVGLFLLRCPPGHQRSVKTGAIHDY